MVQSTAALLRSPTDCADAPAMTSSAASAPSLISPSTNSITDSSSSTTASPHDFVASSTPTQSDCISSNNDNELFRLGLLDGAFSDTDPDIASSFASIAADDAATRATLLLDLDDNVSMRTFALNEQPYDVTDALPLSSSTKPRARKLRTTSEREPPAPTANDYVAAPLSTLELRRKRNRDSMRRARDRQRSEHAKLAATIDALEDRLDALLRIKETRGPTTSKPSHTVAAYSALLRQTEELRDENDALSDRVRRFQHFATRTMRLTAHEQLALEASATDTDADAALLEPLLQWLTPAAVHTLVSSALERVLAVVAMASQPATDAAQTTNILGWHSRRAVEGNWATYAMRKRFLHARGASLAARTWDCTVNTNVADVQQVLAWAAGTKVLHRLGRDAAVIARDMAVPNSEDVDHPIRIRYILLVFRARTRDGSDVIGTVTLNVFGTSVDACLEQKVAHEHGMHALTMYAFVFADASSDGSGNGNGGCDVTLAGRSSDGSVLYARKVLSEVLPSILRWEHTFVAPILRVAG